ncbi:Homeobox-like_domain superfamily [Hexamita inflata]|uniref:Homeobox-like domain superfamily n=1 Tax=Hexamita inflata TaxID=28002 RepID=A0AA86UPK2_9EUKA|nr:Homeobox-like domain superfamily [Hexamita inflata]CAI9959682.1 Homeobox-like domain superfamily [Hexamita inflata]
MVIPISWNPNVHVCREQTDNVFRKKTRKAQDQPTELNTHRKLINRRIYFLVVFQQTRQLTQTLEHKILVQNLRRNLDKISRAAKRSHKLNLTRSSRILLSFIVSLKKLNYEIQFQLKVSYACHQTYNNLLIHFILAMNNKKSCNKKKNNITTRKTQQLSFKQTILQNRDNGYHLWTIQESILLYKTVKKHMSNENKWVIVMQIFPQFSLLQLKNKFITIQKQIKQKEYIKVTKETSINIQQENINTKTAYNNDIVIDETFQRLLDLLQESKKEQ